MSTLSSRNERIVEKSIFALAAQISGKNKFYMAVLAALTVLYSLNLYQVIISSSVIERVF